MTKLTGEFAKIQQVVLDTASIDRYHYHPNTNRHENVAEHSFSVVALVWFVHSKVRSKTDLVKVLQYAVAHDFVEIYAGDTNTYANPEERQQKEVREKVSLNRLSSELQFFPDLVKRLREYQELSNEEARFVWAVDKMQSVILGQMDNWRPYRENKVNLRQFSQKMDEFISKSPSELREIFSELVSWAKQTY